MIEKTIGLFPADGLRRKLPIFHLRFVGAVCGQCAGGAGAFCVHLEDPAGCAERGAKLCADGEHPALRLDGSVICSAVLPYLHFGQYSGKFLSSVSSRIFSRVLFLQAGHKIKWVVFTFLYTSCYLLNKLCIMFCNVFYFYRSVQCTPKKRLSISPQK